MFEKLTQFDLHQRIAAQPASALVFFSGEGCSSCRHLKRVLTQVSARRPDWSIFEVDAQAEMGLTREFEVFHLPTLFLFQDGEFHCELHCEARAEAIEAAVSEALARPPQEAP